MQPLEMLIGADRRVIVAMPQGHPWSATERSTPGWSIVCADITPIEADALIERRMRLDVTGAPEQLTRAEVYARASEN